MHHLRLTCLPLLLGGVLLGTLAPKASATPTCHCFKDRTYNSELPFKADDYLLATTQNSLIAVALGIDKKDIVTYKMSGTNGDHIWVAAFLAQRLKTSVKSLLDSRSNAPSWFYVIGSRGYFTSLPPSLQALEHADDKSWARACAYLVLTNQLGISLKTLAPFAKVRLRELIAATLISRHGNQVSFTDVFSAVRSKRYSWGQWYNRLQINPKEISTLWRVLLITPR